jgi:phage major head subunit gpT-like protein
MPAFKTSDAAELLEPGLKSIFLNRFRRFPEEYTRLLNVLGSQRNFEEDLTFAGFGTVPEKGEGVSVSFEDPIQGNTKRFTHKEFALGFRITRPMWMDDQYGKMRGMTSALGISFAHLAEVQGASPYNNATDTSAENLGADGVALLSTAHPLLGGGTFSNKPATDADISYTEVQNAMINFDGLTDHQGLEIMVQPRKVIVTPTFRFIAEEIFKQDAKPNTADRDDNTVSNKGIELMVSHYITDSDRWFMQSDPAVDGMAGHSIQYIWRERPIFETYDDKDTKDVKANGYARLSVGFTEAFGVYGSTG